MTVPKIDNRTLFFAFSTHTGEQQPYDEWYDQTHIPEVMATTGMVGAQRFRLADTKPVPGSLGLDYGHAAVYELSGSPQAFRDEVKQMLMSGDMVLPDFMVQPFKALFYEAISEPHYSPAFDDVTSFEDRHLWLVFSHRPADPEGAKEYDEWYDGEHIPQVLSAPGLIRAQRFVMSDVKPLPGVEVPQLGHLAVYELIGSPTPMREACKQMLMSGEMVIPEFMKAAPFQSMFLKPVSPFWPAGK